MQTPHRFVGFISSLFAVGITLTQVEQALRIAGALIGVLIGLVTLYQMLRRKGQAK